MRAAAVFTVAFVAFAACDEVPAMSEAPQDSKPAAESRPADAAVQAIEKFIADQNVVKEGAWKGKLKEPPKQTFDKASKYYWKLKTNKGDLKIRLFQDVAPMHVTSTIYLTKVGFYDNVVFHRVIPGFMAQGGDPTGTGTGGPGYSYDGEFAPDALHTKRGILSMANTGRPKTDGSQFFLTFGPTPHLNGKHTVFGEVVEGDATLTALEKCGTQPGRTTERLVIEQATIEVVPGK